MEPTYKVTLQQIAPGKDIQAIKEVIADSFRLSPDKVDFILSRIPIVVKQHTDYVTAQKIQKIMTDAGVECRLELEDAKINAPPVAVPTPPQSTETIKTCPKCGYQARLPNDPLLTAHQGQGECPACGVIVAKYVKTEQDSPETVAPTVANGDPAEEEAPSVFDCFFSALNFFPKPILIGLLLIIALIIYPWIKGKPPTEKPVTPTQAPKKIQTAEQPASHSYNNAPSPMKILPGETKSFTLFCYFPVMHEDKFLPSPFLDATYKVIKNSWQNVGVQVQVQHVSFSSSSIYLWEWKPKDSIQWNLISTNKDVHITKLAGFTEITNPSEKTSEKISFFLNSLIDCNNPVWLKTLAGRSQDEITQLFKEDPGELKQNRYVLYELRLVLSISLPPGEEFGTRDDLTWTTRDGQKVKSSQRSTEVIISTDAVIIDYENSNIVISLHQWAGLNLIQKAKEEGVELILSTNVSNPWNIESS